MSAAAAVTLIVIAKEPVAGRCKTRLCPPLTPAQAASVAEAALADTLATVAATPAARRVLVLDGRPGAWLPPGFDVVPQPDGGLGTRLGAAFDAVRGPALLVGMDTPQLTPALLRAGARTLMSEGVDAVLGPALDGGYWAIGMRRPRPDAFAGVPMSVELTGEAQRRRLRALGLRWRELASLRDVDTVDDARAVAARAPGSRFAAALQRIAGANGTAPGPAAINGSTRPAPSRPR
jgi:rSAM/selenodomain-associated transferase 1